VSTYRYH